MVLPPNEITIP